MKELTDGITNLASSENWRRYLEAQCRFHHYSYGNALLINTQRENATHVAGFHTWRKLNRYVRKGETAIWILAPLTTKRREERDEDERIATSFRWVPVFDIAQTDGVALPSPCRSLQGEDPNGYYPLLERVASSLGFRVEDHSFCDGTNGDCCHVERRIRVESTNAPLQRIKTLAHELAHALLHEHLDSRALAELEAESTAFVVCGALGIDSGAYSFGYVAAWAGGGAQALSGIRSSCARIQRTSSSILACLEEHSNLDPRP